MLRVLGWISACKFPVVLRTDAAADWKFFACWREATRFEKMNFCWNKSLLWLLFAATILSALRPCSAIGEILVKNLLSNLLLWYEPSVRRDFAKLFIFLLTPLGKIDRIPICFWLDFYIKLSFRPRIGWCYLSFNTLDF